MRTRLLLVLACIGGAAAAVVPQLATGETPPSSGSFVAFDSYWRANGGATNQLAITPGGTVSFSYPNGFSAHNAHFTGPGPTSCTPPLPGAPAGRGWSSDCRFDTAGTYRFFCDLHGAGMSGTVLVADDVPTPTPPTRTTPPPGRTTPPPTPPATTPTTPAPGPGGGGGGGGYGGGTGPSDPAPPGSGGSGGGAPSAALRAVSLRVARSQAGTRVRGTANLGRARARLRIALLASRSALGLRGRGQASAGGSVVRATSGPGRVAFAVTLNRAARRALTRRGTLALIVRVTATPAGGGAVRSARAAVTLRAAGGRG